MTRKALSLALASVLSCGITFGADSNYATEDKEKITRNGMSFLCRIYFTIKRKNH